MNIQHKLYPYPVLSYFSDDYINSTFTSKLEVEKKDTEIILNLRAITNDQQLLKLIDEDKAEYLFHIECSSTSYRNVVPSKESRKQIIISEELLNNKVNVCFFIVAKKNISNYTNQNFNSDYENIDFEIEKGNILAIAKQYNIDIQKEKDNLTNIPSIFLIIKREDEKYEGMEIDILKDKIEITLPKEDYDNYALLSNGNYQPLLHSSIVFPTLIYVFETLKTIDLDTIEDFNWFKIIKKVLNNSNIELEKDSIDQYLSYNLAQKIINYPVKRSLKAVISMENGEFDEGGEN